MNARVEAEFELIKRLYPGASFGGTWVLIPHFSLPKDRYNLATTPILFSIPVAYPNTGPDNFFVDVRLTLSRDTLRQHLIQIRTQARVQPRFQVVGVVFLASAGVATGSTDRGGR